MKAIKSLFKWLVGCFAAIMLVGIIFGDSKPEFTPEEKAATKVQAFSFDIPEQNARVEMTCNVPGKRKGYNWSIASLDGKNPPAGKNLYLNFQDKQGDVDPDIWHEVDIHANSGKSYAGDAFMLTAFKQRDIMAASQKAAVFVVANTKTEAMKAKRGAFIPINEVIMTSAKVMSESPCAKTN